MTHPLDIELLDVLEGLGAQDVAAITKAHVRGCRFCRFKMESMVRHYVDVELLDEEG